MPTFNDVEVETKIDVEFEVYCNTCGAGLCSESDTGRGRTRGYLQVRVNACPHCMAEKDDEISGLKDERDNLQDERDNLQDELEQLKTELTSFKINNEK